MLVLKALILFNLGLVLSQPYVRTRYESETTVFMNIPATEKFNMCKCDGKNCVLDVQKSEEACKVFKQRFAYWADPSPYFIICEFDPKPCVNSKGNKVQSYILQVTYDAYYLAVSAINFGREASMRTALQMVTRQSHFPSPLFEVQPTALRTEWGVVGLPVEFEGTTTLGVKDMETYDLCYTDACRRKIDEFCNSIAGQMRKAAPQLMKQYLGCKVRYVYVYNGAVKIDWTMQFHHRKLIQSKTVTSRAVLDELIATATKGIKHEMLKDFRVTGTGFLDYCEITAVTQTPEKYHKDLWDPLSHPYLVSSHEYYQQMWKQLNFGSNGTSPNCLRDIVKIQLTDSNKFARVQMDLWVSMGCAKEQGFKNCQEVTKAIAKQWEAGSKYHFNFWTPKYEFKLNHTGAYL